MRMRKLGALEVSELGFGTLSFASTGIVRANSILPPSAQGRARAVLFLLTNCRRARPEFDAENRLYLFALTLPLRP